MTPTVLIAVIGALSSIFLAAFAYWTTKQKEREAEWRKEKLTYYKAFVESLSALVGADATPEGHRMYAKTTNNLLLFAPQSVIAAVDRFRYENRISNTESTRERHDELLAVMLMAIRKDIGIQPKDDPETFRPKLWSSGQPSNSADKIANATRPERDDPRAGTCGENVWGKEKTPES